MDNNQEDHDHDSDVSLVIPNPEDLGQKLTDWRSVKKDQQYYLEVEGGHILVTAFDISIFGPILLLNAVGNVFEVFPYNIQRLWTLAD